MQVFSKEKFLDNVSNKEFYFNNILSAFGENNWVNRCDGKTEKEIEEMGYAIVEEAMIDI